MPYYGTVAKLIQYFHIGILPKLKKKPNNYFDDNIGRELVVNSIVTYFKFL